MRVNQKADRSVFSGFVKFELDKLQKLQIVALRMISEQDYRWPVHELHNICKIETLATRREKCLVKLCWKWVHGDGRATGSG